MPKSPGADQLLQDVDLELHELEEKGSQAARRMKIDRHIIREHKLFTDSSREMWDTIRASNPEAWHLNMNKFRQDPKAGR